MGTSESCLWLGNDDRSNKYQLLMKALGEVLSLSRSRRRSFSRSLSFSLSLLPKPSIGAVRLSLRVALRKLELAEFPLPVLLFAPIELDNDKGGADNWVPERGMFPG